MYKRQDIAVASHAQLLPAIAQCQEPARANRLTHESRDPQVKILPTAKGCIELEQLKEKMEWKIEEMEAGYDRLIELDPDNEKRYLEKKREVVDIAVSSHAQLLPAIAQCQEPARANRLTHESRDPQVKIREGLKPVSYTHLTLPTTPYV